MILAGSLYREGSWSRLFLRDLLAMVFPLPNRVTISWVDVKSCLDSGKEVRIE